MTRIQWEIIGRMDEGREKEKVIKFAYEYFIMAQEWGHPNNLSTWLRLLARCLPVDVSILTRYQAGHRES